ncbi:hypothetical protein HNQ77_002724 [Silvibacterium bohemicum]|uniref:Uncharacterized protein n=2 Tax=Silvibacterium bohemicum TaxID=1577686 RepID=A0A841K297_9BACT|nr:hypothetical protein [Silvibacterium bohemicum]
MIGDMGGMMKGMDELMQGMQELEGGAGSGGGQGEPPSMSGSQGPGGGLQGLEQEVQQALQGLTSELGGGQSGGGAGQVGGGQGGQGGGLEQLAQELQQLLGGQGQGGGAPSAGGQGGGSGSQPAAFSGNESSALPDLNNLISDASGDSGSSRPTHVGGDLERLRGEVQTAMQNGQMSEQSGAKALADIGSGNIQGVEQDLTGTSGPVTQQAQASADGNPLAAMM